MPKVRFEGCFEQTDRMEAQAASLAMLAARCTMSGECVAKLGGSAAGSEGS